MFICSIRKLLEMKCLLLFRLLFFKTFFTTHKKHAHDFSSCRRLQRWSIFQGSLLFPRNSLTSHNEDFNNIFVVSLFFFSDDRFISKYLLSSPTTPELSLLYRFLEGHNLLHFGACCKFYRRERIGYLRHPFNSGELASSLRFLDLLKNCLLRNIN